MYYTLYWLDLSVRHRGMHPTARKRRIAKPAQPVHQQSLPQESFVEAYCEIVVVMSGFQWFSFRSQINFIGIIERKQRVDQRAEHHIFPGRACRGNCLAELLTQINGQRPAILRKVLDGCAFRQCSAGYQLKNQNLRLRIRRNRNIFLGKSHPPLL